MKFGPIPTTQAEGAVLAHGQTMGGRRFRKGHVLAPSDIEHFVANDVHEVTVALLESDDVDENSAALRLAEAAVGLGVRPGIARTGRVNLFARHAGLIMLNETTINNVNRIDEGITISTLHPLDRVNEDQVVATIKIIPFAVSETALRATETIAAGHPITIREYRPRRVGLIQSNLPGLPNKVLIKAENVVRKRVEALGSELSPPVTVDHNEISIKSALLGLIGNSTDLILIVGASATTDRRDVIPTAITQAGGTIEHFGMPVDPGNLTLIGRIGETPILALPGSARSPRPGGNDLILERLIADIPIDGEQIMGLGVGGLLKEIPSRPLPRAQAAPRARQYNDTPANFGAIILAAGQSRRMGKSNKLLIEVNGKAMVSHAVDAARDAGASPVIIVTGHEQEEVVRAVGHDAIFVHNPHYTNGLSTSLRAGLSAIPDYCSGVLVTLGDMPQVRADHLRRLAAAHDPNEGHLICVPTAGGKRGNPVFWDRRLFEVMSTLSGDVGAKHLIGDYADMVIEVPMDDDAVLVDIDSPEALERIMVDDNREYS
ncbi:MAG: 4-diphosphocytidyl-2C-methyl-D-erythritol kinase [Alphaproteobacteria bacterium]|nr:4-diphosphocytidyl-2C-methyl-D-erythritol kinase [Alphaproteobacteria bacterium]HCP00400.1 4-diphosphocytidyl-2C-methyl-D-erythritol kinase [Rhodospirillaceae bacterium]